MYTILTIGAQIKEMLILYFVYYAESINVYLDVVIETSSAYFACKFINQSRTGIKSCDVTYGPGKSCQNLTFTSYSTYNTYSTIFVEIATTPFMNEDRYFCFIVTASNDSFTVKIEQLITTGIGKLNCVIKAIL